MYRSTDFVVYFLFSFQVFLCRYRFVTCSPSFEFIYFLLRAEFAVVNCADRKGCGRVCFVPTTSNAAIIRSENEANQSGVISIQRKWEAFLFDKDRNDYVLAIGSNV